MINSYDWWGGDGVDTSQTTSAETDDDYPLQSGVQEEQTASSTSLPSANPTPATTGQPTQAQPAPSADTPDRPAPKPTPTSQSEASNGKPSLRPTAAPTGSLPSIPDVLPSLTRGPDGGIVWPGGPVPGVAGELEGNPMPEPTDTETMEPGDGTESPGDAGEEIGSGHGAHEEPTPHPTPTEDYDTTPTPRPTSSHGDDSHRETLLEELLKRLFD